MQFIESICFKNHKYHNLDLHNERWVKTHRHFFNLTPPHISEVLPEIKTEGTFKVRVVYSEKRQDTSCKPYEINPVKSLAVVVSEPFDYSFKYEERASINVLRSKEESEEIIISVEGKITDSSYANLAFWDGSKWLTPDTPLLEGVKRGQLLSEGKIKEQSISISDLPSFEKVCLVNAMLDLGEVTLPISAVRLAS